MTELEDHLESMEERLDFVIDFARDPEVEIDPDAEAPAGVGVIAYDTNGAALAVEMAYGRGTGEFSVSAFAPDGTRSIPTILDAGASVLLAFDWNEQKE